MNEITFGFVTGKTLKAFVYQADGTERDFGTADNGIAMTEVAGTALYDGFYLGSCATIVAGDFVMIADSVAGILVGQGQHKPEVSASEISADLTDIETKIDTLTTKVGQKTIVIDETGGGGGQTQTFVFNEE
jgi:hypothetical protein